MTEDSLVLLADVEREIKGMFGPYNWYRQIALDKVRALPVVLPTEGRGCPFCGDQLRCVMCGRDPSEGPKRITHGRHCLCSACAAQDWSEPALGPCGMHGSSCPPVYAPLGRPGEPEPIDLEGRAEA